MHDIVSPRRKQTVRPTYCLHDSPYRPSPQLLHFPIAALIVLIDAAVLTKCSRTTSRIMVLTHSYRAACQIYDKRAGKRLRFRFPIVTV